MKNAHRTDAAFLATTNKDVSPEPAYSGALSAFRRRYTRDLKDVDAVIWGVPFDLLTSHRAGARFGPQAVRRISAMWEPADNAWPYDFTPFSELAVIDYGDAAFDASRPETIFEDLKNQAAHILKSGAQLYTIGGDHAATHPMLQAHAEHHGELALIHFDAHPDTWHEGTKALYHGNFVFHAAEKGFIAPRHSIQIGTRTMAPNPHNIDKINAEECYKLGIDKIIERIKKRVGKRKAYLTFDIDVLDPSHAPGTGTPVPGGLSSREALMILRGLDGLDIVGCDVVEVSPPYDVADITANAAAAVLQQLLCLQTLRKMRKKAK